MATNEVIMKNFIANLESRLGEVKRNNDSLCTSLCDEVRLSDYESENGIWTGALQRALNEHQRVIIPKSSL